MKKGLPDHLKEALENTDIPAGMVAMPFITPTEKDKFIQEMIKDNTYKITLDKSHAVVSLVNKGDSIGINVSQMEVQDEYHQAKLMGYITIVLIPKYAKNE